MLKILWVLISLFIILLIVVRVPTNGGLDNFASKTDLLGSPGSAEQFLNSLTWLLIGLYILLAINFNLVS
jgi:protein translocase SecG subunit